MRSLARTAARATALAVVSVTALAACTKHSTSGNVNADGGYAGIPKPSAHKVAGGTVTFGMPAGATPNWIFPITPGANSSVYSISYFQNLGWRPLYWAPAGHTLDINYALSLARKPVFSNGDKTVTIAMNSGYKWSDGQPVDAQDVVFFIDLVRAAVKLSAANYGSFSPGYFPQNIVTAKATGRYTLRLKLTRAYNPGYYLYDQLGLLYALPSTAWDIDRPGGKPVSYRTLAGAEKIYRFLAGQARNLSTYATNPLWQVVDGPFKISAFNRSTYSSTWVANAAYSGHKPSIRTFREVAFTSDDAEYAALRAGQLTVGLVPPADYPKIPSLKKQGYNIYGYPDSGWDYMVFNFKDKTGHWNDIIRQLYVRQALAHLIDGAGFIKGVYHGYAAVADGPVPSLPASPFTPANAGTPVYPFSVATARSLLAEHGWKIVHQVRTCESPGTGQKHCGAGIPKGTRLSFNLVYNNGSPAITTEDTSFASVAKNAGIQVSLTGRSFDYILSNYYNVAAPANVDKWAMEDFGGFTQSLYPTTNTVFNTTGTFNIGSYSSPTADKLIRASVFGGSPDAVKAEAAFLARDLPGLFQPDADHVYAWKNTLSGPRSSFWELSQFAIDPELWYFTR